MAGALSAGCGEGAGATLPPRAPTAAGAVSRDQALAELDALHRAQREAHLRRDAQGFTALLAPDHVDLANGAVQARTRAQALVRFEAYFAGSQFEEWDDIAPPVFRISDDGTLATMRVHKRVTQVSTVDGRTGDPETTIFAWLAVAERRGGSWQIVEIASTRDPDPAKTWLEAARDALGTASARARVKSLSFDAAVSSRGGTHHLRVDASDGRRLHYVQEGPGERFVEAWLNGPQAFATEVPRGRAGSRRWEALGAEERAVIEGHSFAWLALHLEKQYEGWSLSGSADFGGARCDQLRAKDALGRPVLIFLDPATRRLRGLKVPGRVVPVSILYDAWTAVNGVQVPSLVRALDERGEYTMTLSGYRVNEAADGVFQAPAP